MKDQQELTLTDPVLLQEETKFKTIVIQFFETKIGCSI